MRTKALILTAVLGAASIATSVAQTVYSVNAVGYVNVVLLPGFNLVANPLVAETNTAVALFSTMPNKSVVYKYDAAAGNYKLITKALGKWTGEVGMTVLPGEGVFVKNPELTNITVTFVGEVNQGSLTNQLPAGYSIVSSMVPQEGTLDSLNFPKANKDAAYLWNAATGAYSSYTVAFGAWKPSVPSVKVAEAFFAKKEAAGAWTRDFNVNQ